MAEQLYNLVTGKVSGTGISSSGTTLTVADGSIFPGTFNYRIGVDNEIMLVTAKSGNDLTVTRGEEGTTAQAHSVGVVVSLIMTAGGLVQYVSENAGGGGGGGGMTNPMTTAGDLIVGGSSGTPTRLAKGTDGQVLTMVTGAEAWATPSGGGGGAATLPYAKLSMPGANNQHVFASTPVDVAFVNTDHTETGFTIPSGKDYIQVDADGVYMILAQVSADDGTLAWHCSVAVFAGTPIVAHVGILADTSGNYAGCTLAGVAALTNGDHVRVNVNSVETRFISVCHLIVVKIG